MRAACIGQIIMIESVALEFRNKRQNKHIIFNTMSKSTPHLIVRVGDRFMEGSSLHLKSLGQIGFLIW